MDHFLHLVEDKMAPVASWMGQNKILSAMQKGFMTRCH